MTSDYVLTVGVGPDKKYYPRTFKTLAELHGKSGPRTLAKLDIEWLSWRVLSRHFPQFQDWKLVTNAELPMTRVRNLKALRPGWDKSKYGLTDHQLAQIEAWLLPKVLEQGFSLCELTRGCDTALGLQLGIALRAVQHLILHHHWRIDLDKPYQPALPLVLLGHREPEVANGN